MLLRVTATQAAVTAVPDRLVCSAPSPYAVDGPISLVIVRAVGSNANGSATIGATAGSREAEYRVQNEVELVNDDGSPCGVAPRGTVHGVSTPLHRAFSCHLLDDLGQMLMTRRALSKRTWPGVWTNSFCGHPRPGESTVDAVHRYSRHELGVDIARLTPVLPDFRYRAVDASGVVENELCPVFTAHAVGSVDSNPLEVVESRWVPVSDVRTSVRATPWAFSPWFVDQMDQLHSATRRRTPNPSEVC